MFDTTQHRLMVWPTSRPADAFAPIADREHHTLDVHLAADGQVQDVRLDGASVWPTWFKIEWKESGELSAKVKGVRLATRYGDAIRIHLNQGQGETRMPAI